MLVAVPGGFVRGDISLNARANLRCQWHDSDLHFIIVLKAIRMML
jgi:hypothetical protein